LDDVSQDTASTGVTDLIRNDMVFSDVPGFMRLITRTFIRKSLIFFLASTVLCSLYTQSISCILGHRIYLLLKFRNLSC